MISFLLAWNPKRAPWRERYALRRDLLSGKPAVTNWGVRAKAVAPGDRLFFIRLGKEPRGIFALGFALSSPYIEPHWDEALRARGKTTRYVDVQFSRMTDPDTGVLVSLKQLQRAPFDEMHWTIQGSGVFMPAHLADALAEELN